MRTTVDTLYAENRSLSRNVGKLLKENRELRKRPEKYEKPSKDSGNSVTPPFSRLSRKYPDAFGQTPEPMPSMLCTPS